MSSILLYCKLFIDVEFTYLHNIDQACISQRGRMLFGGAFMNEKSHLQTNKCFSGSLPDEGLLKLDQRRLCFLDALKITTDFYKETKNKLS